MVNGWVEACANGRVGGRYGVQEWVDGWVDWWTRGMGGLLVIIHDSIHGQVVRQQKLANASVHACMRMLAFMGGFFIMYKL